MSNNGVGGGEYLGLFVECEKENHSRKYIYKNFNMYEMFCPGGVTKTMENIKMLNRDY